MNTLKDFLSFLDTVPVGARGAFRATMQGLFAHLKHPDILFTIRDISDTGCSFAAPSYDFPVGTEFEMRLEINGHCLLEGLHAKVVRSTEETVACTFFDLTDQQECVLDKLVLEIQKREIRQNKLRPQKPIEVPFIKKNFRK